MVSENAAVGVATVTTRRAGFARAAGVSAVLAGVAKDTTIGHSRTDARTRANGRDAVENVQAERADVVAPVKSRKVRQPQGLGSARR